MIVMAFVCFFVAYPVYAKEVRLQRPQAKTLTVKAIEAAQEEEWDVAKAYVEQSNDALAEKVFVWLMLKDARSVNWGDGLFIKLAEFIRHNADWPGIGSLKIKAEGVMPENLPYKDVVNWYEDYPPKTPYGMGRYMQALESAGEIDRARKFFAKWWAGTLTSRSQQKEIYKKYGQYLSMDAHKKRFDALLFAGYYDNALGMAGVLGPGYVALAKARIALAKNKSTGMGKRISKIPESLIDDPGLIYERLRWRRKRNLDKGAIELLSQTPDPSEILNKEAWWSERHIIIRRLLEKKRFKEAYALASWHIQTEGLSYAQAQWLAGWLALRFMDKPAEAYERFSEMYGKVSMPLSRSRAAYWAGRAAQDMGDEKEARRWYERAAEYNTAFYGQIAGAAISAKNEFSSAAPPYLSYSQKREYKKHELMQTAELFRLASMEKTSQKFVNAFLYQDETPKAYRYVAEILAEQGNYHDSVKIAKKATQKGLFLTKQSYPTITRHLRDIDNAEWALLHALIRQESMFDYKAKSHVGARGLMQIMPYTAKALAKKLKVRYKKSELTTDPHYNIQLGSYYISELIKKYDGSYPLAIAAYNAGPNRVNTWLKEYGDPRAGDIDFLDWIELIPIYETRNYVQRVLEGTYVYRIRLKDIQKQPEYPLHVAIRTQ